MPITCFLRSQAAIPRGSSEHDFHARGTTLIAGGLLSMTTATQYREFAKECARLAKEMTSEQHRAALKRMEAVWLRLAEEAEKEQQS